MKPTKIVNKGYTYGEYLEWKKSDVVKLWLDDLRPIPDSSWTLVMTADKAIEVLKTGRVVEISLDHDLDFEHYGALGGKEKTGYEVVLWMEENNVWPEKIHVHSMNPVGRKRMEDVIRKNRNR